MEVSYSGTVKSNVALCEAQPLNGLDEQSDIETTAVSAANTKAEYRYVDKPVYEVVKRVFDIIFSIIGLVIASPIMLITAIAIKAEDGGPILFHEHCIGKNGKPIIKLKFRSMKQNSYEILATFDDEQKKLFEIGAKVKNDPRITKVGGFIRKTSIKELDLLEILE